MRDRIVHLFCESNIHDGLKSKIAQVAQREYDAWTPDEEGGQEEWGGGGICHIIADSIVGLLSQMGIEAMSMQAAVGENHTFVVALMKDGIYSIDIPPYVYEAGSGYSWTKKDGVTITPNDVSIDLITKDTSRWNEYSEMDEAKMYHGSNKEFESPSKDMIFWVTTDPEFSKEYAQGASVHRGGTPKVYAYDVNVKHPAKVSKDFIRIIHLLNDWFIDRPNKDVEMEKVKLLKLKIVEHWFKIGLDNDEVHSYMHWNVSGVEGNRLLKEFLTYLGYDSIYYKEQGYDTYGILDIKSLKKEI